jgi:hypothetical protein
MDHLKILSRAWTITWRYRALWLFGFLFALAGGGSGGGGGGNGGGSGMRWTQPAPSNIPWNTVLIIVLIAVAVMLVLVVALTILRYVTETAIIAGVDEIEGQGIALTVRRGFRLGWSRQAWRLFLTDLVIYLPVVVVALVLLAFAASPLLLLLVKVNVVRAIGIIATIGLALFVILFIIAVALIVSVVMPYIRRRVVLGRQDVMASIRQGVMLVRASLLDTGLMWLLLAAIGIVLGLVMIPVALVILLVAGLIGGVPAGLVYLISHSWVVAAVVGVPLFLIVLVPTLAFIQGLIEVYKSTSWTLAYREVAARHADLLATPVVG